MMRLVVVLLLIWPSLVYGQQTKRGNFRAMLNIHYANPGKQIKAGKNDGYIVTQTTDGLGFSAQASKKIFKQLHVGAGYKLTFYNIDREIVSEQIEKRYYAADYITSVDMRTSGLYTHSFVAELSWVFKGKIINIEPVVEIGRLFSQIEPRDEEEVAITRKKINSNYTENIHLSYLGAENPWSTYYAFGLRLNKRVSRILDVTAGVRYSAVMSSMEYHFDVQKTDFLGNSENLGKLSVTNRISDVRFDIGVHLMLWRYIKESQQKG